MTLGYDHLCRWLLKACVWSLVSATYQFSEHGLNTSATTKPSFLEGETIRSKRLLVTEKFRHWPQGVIPYKFESVDEKNGRDIIGAMAVYEYFTPLRFVPWQKSLVQKLGHVGFIKCKTTYGRGYSLLGFTNDTNGQWLDCPHMKTCIHEFGHALGFQHEQYHPERDKWLRVNKGNLFEYDTWRKMGWGTYDHAHFDVSTVMLYGPGAYAPYNPLFPELELESRYFYMLRELCHNYECYKYPQCKNHRLPCANEGFVSVVGGKCACVCPQSLDPDSQCRTILKTTSSWPSGTFSLLEHKDGCPAGSFRTGLWRHFGIGRNKKQSDGFKGDLTDPKVELSFCTQNYDDNKKKWWPLGAYCFPKKGACPQQTGFEEAKIIVPGRTDTSENTYIGYLPDGEHVRDATLEFCCSHTGFSYIPSIFPTQKPFILFALADYKNCQQVAGMHAKMEKFSINGAKVEGELKHSREGEAVYFHYCVYTPLNRDCGGVIEMGPNRRTFTFESDKTNPTFRECTWIFRSSNEKDVFVFSFDEFDVNSSKTECDNNVEVQPSMIAQKGTLYCDQRKDKSTQSLFGQMLVRFRNENAKSYFKATVKWLAEKEMCYDPQDSGWTYRGTVNYTRGFESCLPWTEVTSCLHHSYRAGDYLDGLEGNYCRNPDGSFRPWCYTQLDGCKRDFCDVCHLGKPFDRFDNCTERKRNGLCTKDDTDCAETCSITPSSIKLGTDVHCNRPETISGGVIQGPTNIRYNLGDKVTYKCTKSGNTIERTCLSTGEWTAANTACLPCPLGFIHFQHSCYKFYFEFMTTVMATAECKKVGATLAMPKTKEENTFVDSIRYRLNAIWLGLQKRNGVYTWNDGTKVDDFLWRHHDVPNVQSYVLLTVTGFWFSTDSWDWKFNFVCQRPVTDDNPDCKDFLDNCASLVSSLPDSNCDKAPGLNTYCRHSCSLCPTDCDQHILMNQANPMHSISSDRRYESHRICTWTIKAPNKDGRFVVDFNEFQVKAAGDRCVDSVEVRPSRYGPPYTRYCDTNYTRSLVINHDEVFVRFLTPDTSKSHFKATIKWIPDSDMCYSVKDKGRSYNGHANYTETFQPCLSWSEALSCSNTTLQYGSFLDNLEDNYCRNHDGSERPWCFNGDCQKQYCDVCGLVLPSDTSSDCQKFKTDGKCTTDQPRAVTECAETCGQTIQGTKTKVSDITCNRPRYIPGGIMQSGLKLTYKVGQKIRYRCPKHQMFVKKTCMTSGTWSTAKTACLECPFGFIPFERKCYRYFKLYRDMEGAQKHCLKYKAVVAAPKDMEVNQFVSRLRGNERIWLGAKKGKDGFEWNDGTQVTWPNWYLENKKFSSRDDCMVLEKSEKRTDDWCKKKLFHFVCQAERQLEQADCKDYLDICPSLMESVPESNCDAFPSLQVYCRSSCGLCSNDCKREARLTSRLPTFTIEANSNIGHNLCTWNFKGDDNDGRFILTLDEFTVSVQDSLTIKNSQFGDVLYSYSGTKYQSVTYVDNNMVMLTFKTSPKSNSKFKATVRWIRDSDMCYDMKDKGWSYNGNVNYTKEFQPCLPWNDALECPHNPLKNGDFEDNLEGNYCRNPDQSDQPWCYTGQCEKHYCDVCHLEKPVDRSSDCGQRKQSGQCSKDSIDCAQTCQIAKTLSINKVSATVCGHPGAVSEGTIQGPTKSYYNVGDKVVFTCTKSSFPIERVCLSSGQWSDANTACLACPSSFSPFRGNCYKFIQKRLDYADAVKECQALDSWVATPKSLDENTFIHSLSLKPETGSKLIWIGAQKDEREGHFYWADNTPFAWTYWVIREPFRSREKCVLMERSKRWDDEQCRANDRVFGFVCQREVYEKPDCKDFLGNCPHLLSLTKKSICDSHSHLEILCRYTCGLCPRNCDRKIRLDRSQTSYLIRADRRKQSNRYCTWNIMSDSDQGRMVLLFEDFDVASSGNECRDMVEVTKSQYGAAQRYCNSNKKPFIEMISNKLIVRFRTPGTSQSHIKIRVKWIKDSDLCYNEKDKGWSYDGKVNYAANLQPCQPWSQALSCPHNPLKEKNFLDNLEGNYCRNPDQSDRPWCYVSQCQRQDCDVCNLSNLKDVSRDCGSFKANGLCTGDIQRALQECAVTCQLVSQQTLPRVTDTQCRRPRRIRGSTVVGRQKNYYTVGENINYKCSRSNSQVTRTCLTSGQWSEANTACLECPVGWIQFENNCYHYVNQFIQRPDAEIECDRLSAKIANAKSMDTAKFLGQFCPKDDLIWLGVMKSKIRKTFTWSDGTSLSWTNWRHARKNEASREDCVLMNGRTQWFDDWCNDKYYTFVCQTDKDDNPDCNDFKDTCPQLVQLKENNQCDSVLNKFCRKTCGQCN